MKKVRMLNQFFLVRLDEENRIRRHRELTVVTEGYREGFDWETAEVVACPLRHRSQDIIPGDRVLIRARSGGVAGTDVSDVFGPRMVVVHWDEIWAQCRQAEKGQYA